MQNAGGTITTGVDHPYAIMTDGLGDFWVENNFSTVNVYPALETNSPFPIKSFSFTNPVTGVAVHNEWIAFGGNNSTTLEEIANYLSGSDPLFEPLPTSAYSVAWDTAGNLYCGTIGDALNVLSPAAGTGRQLVALGYFPWGIAVDSARSRVYVSDANNSQINVYSTTNGALLHTIQNLP